MTFEHIQISTALVFIFWQYFEMQNSLKYNLLVLQNKIIVVIMVEKFDINFV